jgi:hypothetical protein
VQTTTTIATIAIIVAIVTIATIATIATMIIDQHHQHFESIHSLLCNRRAGSAPSALQQFAVLLRKRRRTALSSWLGFGFVHRLPSH